MSIELAMIDMLGDEQCLSVVRHCWNEMPRGFFKRAQIFSPRIERGFEFVWVPVTLLNAGSMERHLYNVWRLREFPKHIDADYVLTTHIDGFIVNPDMWNDEWLQWDYIGAPWRKDGVGGNSAFCFQSRRMLRWISRHPKPIPHDVNNDVFVCDVLRNDAIRVGFKFAPFEVAMRFSLELEIQGMPRSLHDTFGFHGAVHLENARKIAGL